MRFIDSLPKLLVVRRLHAVRGFPLIMILSAYLAYAGSMPTAIANEFFRDNANTHEFESEEPRSNRETPLVKAIAKARPSVVNLRGKKLVSQTANRDAKTSRQVNGMGTGIVLDPRGYILTNHHVVENVNRIEVTLADGTTTVGTLLAVDRATDLAIIKINTNRELTVMPLGSSTDLMLGESVAAIGNAYGYEHTVTRGIISELGRTVQVSDEQVYYNLIQTDAAINPGNSGGPLLNMDGDMIGINVAMRVGAQGIAFAIPVNDAIEVAADLMRKINQNKLDSGVKVKTIYRNHKPILEVEAVDPESSAAQSGLKPGDQISAINSMPCFRRVDFERCLIDCREGETLNVELCRNSTPLQFALSAKPVKVGEGDIVWSALGIKLRRVERPGYERLHPEYRYGLQVDEVRANSQAYSEGIRVGDIIVIMDRFQTESIENVQYILNQPNVANGNPFEFYIFRGSESLKGTLRMSTHAELISDRVLRR
ncbi:MAG TPA: trypsin-like peptidase domain-containing protein [Pirellulaceae bacterium]|nr:trypsin-like peptidase domain-containing protein [Pirellulaceae bacterium]HMP69494.1 trypsin-like peptidase domain-containing protein [Pirellulaceae bacterium]